MVNASPVKWGLYVRLSDNPYGTKTGTERQLLDGASFVKALQGVVSKEYLEDDTSAFKQRPVQRQDPLGNVYTAYRVIRPDWSQALHDLRTGVISALWVWDLDRLARDNRDLEDAIEVVVHYGARVVDHGQQVNLMTDEGRTMARMLVAFANKSSAQAAKRTTRWHQEQREKGRTMGGRRPFGWAEDKISLKPDEAQLIREAFVDITTRGKTIHQIALDWAAAGRTTPRGSIMRRSFVNEVMTNPRLAGVRTYKDEPVGVGNWEPILTPDEFERLSVLVMPKTRRPGGNRRRYLFTSFLRCGLCLKSMTGYARKPGVHIYACRARADGGCGKVARDGRAVDAYLTELVLAWFESDATKLDSDVDTSWPREIELAEMQAEMDDVRSQAKGRKGSSLTMLLDRMDELEEIIATLRAERAEHVADTTVVRTDEANLRERWGTMELDEQRRLIARAMIGTVVQPAGKGKLFDPTLLEPAMRGARR